MARVRGMDEFAAAYQAANDALSRLHLNDRREQEAAAGRLAQQLVIMSHEKPSDDLFQQSLGEINRRIFDFIHSSNISDKFGAVMAMDRIISFQDFEGLDLNLARYANYLRMVLPAKDVGLMREASVCMGKIFARGGLEISEMVDFELNRIFQWLQDKSETNQIAACLVAESLLLNAPSVSNAYLSTIFDSIWSLLRDSKSAAVQEAASKAIRATFTVVKSRYDQASMALFGQRILNSLTEELKGSSSSSSLVSSLVILGHLIDVSADVLNLENSSELFEILLNLLSQKSQSLRQPLLELIPALAAQVPQIFAHRFLERWIAILVDGLKKEKDRTLVLIAIASTANALGAEITLFIGTISSSLKSVLTSSSKSRNEEHWLFSVIGSLAKATQTDFLSTGKVLVPLILQQELSESSVAAVVSSIRGAPDLVPFVEDRVLQVCQSDLLSGIPARINLAIKLITSTPFHRAFLPSPNGRILIELVESRKVPIETRLLASKALISHSKKSHKPNVFCESYQQVDKLVGRLLTSCVLESSPQYIEGVVCLLNCAPFDLHWSSSSELNVLLSLFNVGTLQTKLEVIEILQRISANRLRSLVRPHFRSVLLQFSSILKSGQENEELLGTATVLEYFVQIDEDLMRPYVRPFVDILIELLSLNNETLSIPVLNTLTHLVQIAPGDFFESILQTIDLLSQIFQDLSSESLRLASLRCLGTLLRNVDRDIVPTHKHVVLIQEVIMLMKIETAKDVRNEALRLLGIIGAIDPYKMRSRELEIASQDLKEGQQSATAMIDDSVNLTDGGLIQEDQYPVVATNSLLKILKDPSLAAHHNTSVQALVYIFRSVKVKASAFLPQTLPVLMAAMKTEQKAHLEFYFQSLSHIVSSVSLHIRPFVPELVELIHDSWCPDSPTQAAILTLVEALVLSLKGECKEEIGSLVTPCLRLILNTEFTHMVQRAMRVLAVIGLGLSDHIPSLIKSLHSVMESENFTPDVNVAMLKMLCHLLPEVDFNEHIPSLLRIIAKSLERSDTRVKAATIDLISLLMKYYEPAIKPHVPWLVRLADDNHVSMSVNQMAGENSRFSVVSSPHPHSTMLELDVTPSDLANVPCRKLVIGEGNLRRAWEGFMHCTSKEDWFDWMKRLGQEFIRESPSQSIRACSIIASTHNQIVKDLFNVSFLSCWNELSNDIQDELISAFEEAFASQEVPAEVLQTFLNLAEFMEHEEHLLPIDITTLGSYAIRCHAYAKALYYKELEFQMNPSTAIVESLISLNSQLQLPDAATGILNYAEKAYEIKLKESWYEKLQQWDDALCAYEAKWKESPDEMEALLGIFRCKLALGDWGGLSDLACDVWEKVPSEIQSTIAPWASSSTWGLGKWDLMSQFVEKIPEETIDGSFFRAILAVKDSEYERVHKQVVLTRERLDAEITPMINESYSRAYRTTVRVQMLSELEEVVEYQLSSNPTRQETIRDCWSKRLLDCQETVDVWQRMLKIRSLVIQPAEEQDLWMRFSGLCRRMQRPLLSRKVLLTLLGADEHEVDQLDLAKASPPVVYALLEHYWDVGERERALGFMKQYARLLGHQLDLALKQGTSEPDWVDAHTKLLSRCYVRLGKWYKLSATESSQESISSVMECFLTATSYDKNSYKAWHGWALTNFDMAAFYERQRASEAARPRPNPYIVPAIQGFFRSISLSQGDGGLQDSLRLLTLWFRYGSQPEVNAAVGDGFYTVPVDNWLQVIPQLIARIHVPSPQVRRLVHHVLADIGRQHPQALLYPLTVASKAQSISRRTSALAILDKMKSHSARLVEQAVMVSQELIRVAITWEELWYEALEEASKLYFGEHNIAAMFQALEQLHNQVERGRETQRETLFYQAYGATLKSARELCQRYKKSGNEDDLKEAWDLYYQVFRKINKQLPQLVVIDLENASPRLLNARNLDIPIPGTYRAGVPVIKIASVAPVMSVISSKQRPRKLVFVGSDGRKYKFLLKGHEDLRQDERVMQLFGLVNSMLSMDRETAKRHLAIQRFSVVPLSQNTGLIGWVPHCDTIHTLIRDYRESRGILLSAEHRMMLQFAPDYDHLTELQKVEVFEHAMSNTDGLDLNRVLWKKSKNAESWLDRRTTFTRSLAVMSMVGYILGLGDRHPSNLMIDQVTGRVVHIDFGDCFDVAQEREKFPEKVPFRLTRMMIKAMEVSQIEGTFRIVCEHTMRVLRENKDSVMAVLEAFVYDPLINWRILTKASEPQQRPRFQDNKNYSGLVEMEESANFPEHFSTTRRARLGSEISRLEEESINRPDALNAGALNIVTRVSNKLTGREYNPAEPLDTKSQIERLIEDATKIENLCQAYVGWCPFW